MKSIFRKLFLVATALFAVSCSIDDDASYVQPDTAYGIIANASPSSGDLFFFADANQIGNQPLQYSDAEGYFFFRPGDRVLSIKNDAGQTLATADVSLGINEFFSALAVNTFNDIELVVYEDQAAKPTGNQASVRFINLSPDADEIDIDSNGTIVRTGLAFKQASPFLVMNAGQYTFEYSLTSDGSDLHSQTVTLQPGRIYTIYTKGFASPPTGSNDTFSAELLRNY